MLNAFLAATALLTLSGPPAPAAAAPGATAVAPNEIPASLDWRIEPAQAEAPAGAVRFELGYRSEHHSSSNGWSAPLSTFDGLTAAQLDAPGQPVAFTLHRDAGDFACKGVAGQGKGVGTCLYRAKADFPAALAKRGLDRPEPFQQFQLAMSDMGLAYVDELKRQGYATPGTTDLVRAAEHGVGLARLKAFDGLGYRFGDVATLVKVTDHGVSPRYIEAMTAFGFAKLPAEQLVRMRDHGVSTGYVTEMRTHGYASLTPDDLVKLRDHGVSGGFVAQLQAEGYSGLAPDALQRLKDHGVSVGFIRAANHDGQHLTPDELIHRRDRGERD